MKLLVQIIECELGYQAETAITATWTAYSTPKSTVEKVKTEVDKLADILGATIEYEL